MITRGVVAIFALEVSLKTLLPLQFLKWKNVIHIAISVTFNAFDSFAVRL
jgi:hypothetical protein